MKPKLANYAILQLITLFYLQKELKTLQEASVDIYKASQKAYNNALPHKEYLTVRIFLGNPNTHELLNGWNQLMKKKKMILLKVEWRKNNPQPPKNIPKPASVARGSSLNMKKQPKAQEKGKGKAPDKRPYSQGYRSPKIQQDAM
ncbi:hypothetical protein O181_089130 [Austropuccinia psidii MF-1]|uniref:Uncharacterized protein n=1 Tax=Austropuccinia psidii MF-1 TaxID=1389203 RepID=A0A9Q3IT75_9BASI|nr:hypothetical protein [Austropuccinia psidii MF-1]